MMEIEINSVAALEEAIKREKSFGAPPEQIRSSEKTLENIRELDAVYQHNIAPITDLEEAASRNRVAGMMARLTPPDEPCESKIVGGKLILLGKGGCRRELPIVGADRWGVYADVGSNLIYVEHCDAVIEMPEEETIRVNSEINEFTPRKKAPLREGRYLIGAAAQKFTDKIYRSNPAAN